MRDVAPASNAPTTSNYSHNSVIEAIPDTPVSADPARRPAPTAPAASRPVICPPDRCASPETIMSSQTSSSQVAAPIPISQPVSHRYPRIQLCHRPRLIIDLILILQRLASYVSRFSVDVCGPSVTNCMIVVVRVRSERVVAVVTGAAMRMVTPEDGGNAFVAQALVTSAASTNANMRSLDT